MLKWSIWRVFGKSVACGQRVLPDMSIINWTKIDEKCQNGQFGDFSLSFEIRICLYCVYENFDKSQLLNTPTLANQNKNKKPRKFKNLQIVSKFLLL